ncbi:MAG: hypothetical protein U0835_14455 [Isosphaeraceae bacterium]
MPSRIVCVAILVYWSVAAWGVVTRDLLPELSVGGPPDLRMISAAGDGPTEARWSVEVIDDPSQADSRRSVGQAVTRSRRKPDGWVEMTSRVWFDSGKMFRGTALGVRGDERIEFVSAFDIDPSGNLRSFHAGVKSREDAEDMLRIEGRLKDRNMEVVTKGPLPFLNKKLSFEYQPRAVVGSQFGPLDRLPGLQVGQRWDERVANPLTGQVETVRVDVRRKAVIHWDKSPVETLEVFHTSKAVSARTWVRRDGVVLRQEVPFPLLRLVLERQPDPTPDNPGTRGPDATR